MEDKASESRVVPAADLTFPIVLAPLCNLFTLQFPNPEANKAFYVRSVHTSRIVVDRLYIVVKLGFAVIGLVYSDGEPLTALVLTIWFPALFTWLLLTLSPKLYIKIRIPILVTWRMVEPVAVPFLAEHCNKFKADTVTGRTAFPILLLVNSHAFSLLVMGIFAALPFWLHLLVQPYVMVVTFFLTTNLVTTNLCRCCSPAVQSAHSLLNTLSYFLQPFQTPVMNTVHDMIAGGTCSTCPALQLVLFVQLSLGVVAPTMITYTVEWAARLQFAAQFGSCYNLRPVMRWELASAKGIQLGLTTAQGCIVLMLLWRLLDIALA